VRKRGIKKIILEIINMLHITKLKSGYNFRDDDLAHIFYYFDMNLFIIAENNENSNAIVYWKINRPNIGIFYKDNHWTPAIEIKTNEPKIFSNVIINTIFPERSNIIKYVKNYMDKNINNKKTTQREKNIGIDYDDKHRVLSINIEHEGIKKHAIIDTGSNISCIDISLIKNLKSIKNKEKVSIMGANNTKLEQLGKIDLMIKTSNQQYFIDAFVIKGLNCKILLGNDFNIKNNLIINFKNKNIKINDDIIPMDEVWYNHHKENNNSNNRFIEYNIASTNYETKYIGKIICKDNRTKHSTKK